MVVVAALVLTPVANAHLRTGAVAVDYRASVSPLGGALGRALTVRVFRTDLALALRVHSGHTVLVLGYLREPFLRLDAAGIAVNENSPTAGAARLVKAPARSAGSSPAWRLRSRGGAIVWHDARLRGLPPGVDRRPWSVPLIVDGRLRRLEGDVWRVHAPPVWPWLALGMPFIALTIFLLSVGRAPLLRLAAVVLGTVAAAGTIGSDAGFAFSSSASDARWVEFADEGVFVLVGLAVIVRGSRNARSIAGGALGLLGLMVGFSKVPVLLHGLVLSAAPATLARVLVALTIWSGAAAATAGLGIFFDELEPDEEIFGDQRGTAVTCRR